MSYPLLLEAGIIPWSCPVVSFGNWSNSQIATVGINPSNLEFIDNNGHELIGFNRRFHTLNSFKLQSWKNITQNQIEQLFESYDEYFLRRPYDGWFKPLDFLFSGSGISYYFPSLMACHLDLVPYATFQKWNDLSPKYKLALLEFSKETLGLILANSNLKVLILNGQSVVDNFQKVFKIDFERLDQENWTLPRSIGDGVKGYSYHGEITELDGIKLNKKTKILGYNHNIQSSYGVTIQVKQEIKNWITSHLDLWI